MDSVARMPQLVLVLVLDAVDALSAIELRSEQFVRLHKFVQLLGQVGVLVLQHLRVSAEGLALVQQVVVESAALLVGGAEAVDLAATLEERVLHGLEFIFCVSCSVAHVGVAALTALQLLLEFVDFGGCAVVLPLELAVVTRHFLVHVTGVRQVTRALLQSVLLAVEVMCEFLNQTVKVFNANFNSLDFSVQMCKFVSLMLRFTSLLVADFLQALDFSPHFGPLHLH